MPELESGYGYFLTLGGMALLAIGLLVYFWRQGWIFQSTAEFKFDKTRQYDEELDDK
jgi:hypothetical protein